MTFKKTESQDDPILFFSKKGEELIITVTESIRAEALAGAISLLSKMLAEKLSEENDDEEITSIDEERLH